MKITSMAFKQGEKIPVKYTCQGKNINPPLLFEEIPASAKSLVLIVEDPDAPAKPWVHWVVFNIPVNSKGFPEDGVAEGVKQGLTSGNILGYEGPCPPENEHRYFFRLYALDKKLDLPEDSDRRLVLKAMEGHVLDTSVLMGVYQKERIRKKQL